MIYVLYYSSSGVAVTGLSPTFDIFKKVSDASDVTPPAISEIAGGYYKFTYVPTEAIVATIDSNDGTMSNNDRYKAIQVTPTDNVSQTIFTSTPTAGGVTTFQSILNAVFAMAQGNFTRSGNTYTFYDDDGVTVLYTFTTSSTGRS